MSLPKCAPCANNDLTRLAVEVLADTPMCGACVVEVQQFRLVADLEPDEPATVRRPGLPVPAMTRGYFPTPVESVATA